MASEVTSTGCPGRGSTTVPGPEEYPSLPGHSAFLGKKRPFLTLLCPHVPLSLEWLSARTHMEDRDFHSK